MCQVFSHFLAFLDHLVLAKLAISSIRVKAPNSPLSIVLLVGIPNPDALLLIELAWE